MTCSIKLSGIGELHPLRELSTHTLHTQFIIIFLVLFTERACPQLAKANLGGSCLNKQSQALF